ncbi:MAG: hypothetical protein H6742_20245 [Alphaproteobacteria bacterium]|nr:hypothetical protein [Alphaproteobacteria bacterium]
MGRFAAPFLFLSAGAFILWHNATYNDRVLLIPGIDYLYTPAVGDPELQGRVSGIAFLIVGGLLLLWSFWKRLSSHDDRYGRH